MPNKQELHLKINENVFLNVKKKSLIVKPLQHDTNYIKLLDVTHIPNKYKMEMYPACFGGTVCACAICMRRPGLISSEPSVARAHVGNSARESCSRKWRVTAPWCMI